MCTKQFDRKTKKLTDLRSASGHPAASEPSEQTDKVGTASHLVYMFAADASLQCVMNQHASDAAPGITLHAHTMEKKTSVFLLRLGFLCNSCCRKEKEKATLPSVMTATPVPRSNPWVAALKATTNGCLKSSIRERDGVLNLLTIS